MTLSNEEIIGREEVNDLEAILAITNTDVNEQIHAVKDNADAIFTWDYEKGQRPALNKLYEKAKGAQWNGETDLPWDTDVDQEQVVIANAAQNGQGTNIDLAGTSLEKWGDHEWLQFGIESQNWTLSQFMHGEQGALVVYGQDRRDGALDRRQVLRVDPGDGRGPSRRGVRQVPRRQVVGSLSDQRPLEDVARRHHRGLPLGHDVPGHADHGRGPRAGGLRVHAPAHDRAAAQATAALRDGGRGSPRRVRRALAEGVLRGSERGRDPRAPGVRLRSCGPHARSLPAARGVGPHGRAGARKPSH